MTPELLVAGIVAALFGLVVAWDNRHHLIRTHHEGDDK